MKNQSHGLLFGIVYIRRKITYDDVGLRSPVVLKPFQPRSATTTTTTTTTVIVARAWVGSGRAQKFEVVCSVGFVDSG